MSVWCCTQACGSFILEPKLSSDSSLKLIWQLQVWSCIVSNFDFMFLHLMICFLYLNNFLEVNFFLSLIFNPFRLGLALCFIFGAWNWITKHPKAIGYWQNDMALRNDIAICVYDCLLPILNAFIIFCFKSCFMHYFYYYCSVASLFWPTLFVTLYYQQYW